MKKFIIIFITILLPVISFSQINKDGLPFIKKYTDKDYGDAGQIWAIEQDTRGIMYFGCNYGLKTFDGKKWKSYNNPNSTILKSLAVDDNGLVYFGAESDFGVMLPDSTGELSFYSLFSNILAGIKPDFTSVWKTLIAGDRIYFQSFEKLFYTDLPIKIDASEKLLNIIHHIKPEKEIFHLSFSVKDNLYIREWGKGIGIVKNDRIELIPEGEQFAFLRVYIMLPYDENRILIGTRSSGFYLYDTTKKENAITPFYIENQDLINNSSLYNGVLLHDDTYAIGTVNDGVIFLDKNGKITAHFNEKTGFLKQFVFSTYSNSNDVNSPFWFFNGEDGIYKVNISNPFKEWNKYTGLETGSVLDAVRFNDVFYVITGNGIFYLQEKDNSVEFKLIDAVLQPWDLFEFNIPGTNIKKLLLGSANGVFEIKDSEIVQIAEIQHAYKLYQSKRNPQELYVGNSEGLNLLTYKNSIWLNEGKQKNIFNPVRSIFENENFIAVGANSGVSVFHDFRDSAITILDSLRGLPLEALDYFITQYNEKTLIAAGAGLYTVNFEDTTAVPLYDFGKQYTDKKRGVYSFFENDDSYWLSVYETNTDNANHKLIRFIGKEKLEKDTVFSKILPQKTTYVIYPDGNYIWVGNEKGLFKFDKSVDKDYSVKFNTLISKVTTTGDSLLFAGNNYSVEDNITSISLMQQKEKLPVLKYKKNKIIFEWAAPFFEKEEEIKYSYRLLGETEKWSKWKKKSDTRYTNLFEGEYTFEVKAINIYNTESTVARYSFTILPPWYRTYWAYLIFVVVGIFIIIIIIKLYTKKLKRENEKLELTVKERTAEIRMQNEEITAQRDEIQVQKEEVEKSKDKIERQQKNIMDSIHYASRIQEAVLPPDEYLQNILGDHFVLFKPRDIVSGDFYWATQRGNKTVIVAADCTGHGVPGAFMSMLGISFLNEIVNKEEILQANIILNRLRENVKRSLRQTGKENEAKDGMDVAICIIDMDEMKLQFAGAYNPLYLLRAGEIEKVKADRMPIGIYLREKESFANNIVDIQKGDYIYIFSDGYVDQFGGPTDNKIKSAKFKSLLLENHKKSPDEQKEALVKYLEEWMAYKDNTGRVYKQVDDILIIGIEI
ncbi:MAG: SpoIIE family protein phosphatase [Bacteroidales bacterium]|nr:SpoIIE family protein phosphatase [Bacteroidales bacterium]